MCVCVHDRVVALRLRFVRSVELSTPERLRPGRRTVDPPATKDFFFGKRKLRLVNRFQILSKTEHKKKKTFRSPNHRYILGNRMERTKENRQERKLF